jgi:tetratricopeptide (TPR) repeat protein
MAEDLSTLDHSTFHRRVAGELAARYVTDERAPEGWRETMAWHWEQAGALAEATDATLEVAEARVTHLDFITARHWVQRTLDLIERLDPVERRIYELRTYALALSVLEFGGQYREGLDYARRMLRVAQTRKNREAEARAHLAIGRMQRELAQLTVAEAALQQARALAERDELGELEVEVRTHLAKVHQLQGRHLEAFQELQLAQEEQEQHDDRVKLARVFTVIGDNYRVLGASREALTFYTRALSLEQGRGSPLGQAILKDKIALALMEQNKLQEALGAAEESLRMRESLSDIVGQARSHTVLGMLMSRLDQHTQALAHFEQARDLEEQTQNRRGQGIALLHLGDAARALHNFELAREQYLRALALGRQDNDQIALARTLERLGDLSFDEDQREAANSHWIESLKIREALHHFDEATLLRERIRAGLPRRAP